MCTPAHLQSNEKVISYLVLRGLVIILTTICCVAYPYYNTYSASLLLQRTVHTQELPLPLAEARVAYPFVTQLDTPTSISS